MYASLLPLTLSALRAACIVTLLFLGTVREGYGQTKVYATSYGYNESGPGVTLPIVGTILSEGLVINPGNAIEPNSLTATFTELRVGGLIGDAYAIYQLEFVNNGENLPAGTSVYVRLIDNTSTGLLGLALASTGFVSVYKNANNANRNQLDNGETEVLLADGEVIFTTISGTQYLQITPSECFNAIRFALSSQGLLGLLATGNIRIYHAYYECPEIIIPTPNPICIGETVNLTIENPFSCGEYRWFDSLDGDSIIYTGTTYNVAPTTTTTYYVEHTGIDASTCGRTPITITVNPAPSITLQPIPAICEGETTATLAYGNPANNPDQYSITWDNGTPPGFTDVTNAPLPSSPITISIPATAEMGTYSGTLIVRNSTTGCESEGIPFSVQVLPQPGKPHLTITDVLN